MAYNLNTIISAADFNTLASGTNSGQLAVDTTNLNSILGVGYGNKGYGQPSIPAVNGDQVINATNWNQLTTGLQRISQHQGASIGSMKFPAATDPVEYMSNLVSNINTVTLGRLNAKQRGTPVATVVKTSNPWAEKLTITFQINFQSGDQARYFFNSGGQIKLNASHTTTDSTSNGLDRLVSKLLSEIGDIYLSAPSTGAITVAGTQYNGVTQINASPALSTDPKLRAVFNSTCGYYAWNNTTQVVLKQFTVPETTLSNYGGTYAALSVATNGAQGVNGDAGSQITVTLQIVEVPSGKNVPGTTSATLTLLPPNESFLSNSWGAVTVNGSSAQSGSEVIPPPQPNVVCISVIDESSLTVSTMQTEWANFRKNYPSRIFYLLQPGGPSYGDLKVPTSFTADAKAFGPLTVKRDGGVSSEKSDWFTICNLSSITVGTIVALAIDNSGSMTTSTVAASYNYFISQCLASGIPIYYVSAYTENWVAPLNVTLS